MNGTQPHAIVIGGSVGGLAAAGLFRSIGWRASVFERAVGDLTGRGAGLGVSAELLRVMDRIGARLEPSGGAAHHGYVWMDADGAIVFRHDRAAIGSTWARVYRPLRDNVPAEDYRQGMALETIEQDADQVTAIFADRTRVTGDLLVGADGVLSTVRHQFQPDVAPQYTNYVAWRGLIEERDVPPEAVEALGGHLVFCFPEGEMLLAMSAPGEGDDMRPGHRRIYFIWYRPVADDGLADLFTDDGGINHGVSIPPPLIRQNLVRAVKTSANTVLATPIAAIVNSTDQPMLQAISDLVSTRLTFGRVALMGDAAFVARPHSAGGVSKAALDAQCLVDMLVAENNDVGAALARYDTVQQDFGLRLVTHARYLGAYLEGWTKSPEQRRGHERARDPAQIIRDYGAPNMLHNVDPDDFQSGRVT